MADRPTRAHVALVAAALLLAGGCHWVARASVDAGGGDANGRSHSPSISDDGRLVAFTSTASDLVPGDGNGSADVFVRDLRAGTTTRVSIDATGGDSDGASEWPAISGDGHHLAFQSSATDLVPGADAPVSKVYLRDLRTGTTTLVSAAADGSQPDGPSTHPAISDDGRHVAFASLASNLVPGGNGRGGVFVRDLVTGTTTRVDLRPDGGEPNGTGGAPAISDDGRVVSYSSEATDLVAGDGNGRSDVFVRDLVTGTTTWSTVDHLMGAVPPKYLGGRSLSGDGHHVGFAATDVDATGEFVWTHVYVHDLRSGTTRLVGATTEGAAGDGDSSGPALSDDGRFAAFSSWMPYVVPGDGNDRSDVFVQDLRTGTIQRRSVDPLGREADGASEGVAISGDGRYVAFPTLAALATGDGTTGFTGLDVVVVPAVTPTVDSVAPSALAPGTSAELTIRGEGFRPDTRVYGAPGGPAGVTYGAVTVVSETELRVEVVAAPDAASGDRTLLVAAPGSSPGPLAASIAVCASCLAVA